MIDVQLTKKNIFFLLMALESYQTKLESDEESKAENYSDLLMLDHLLDKFQKIYDSAQE